MPTPETRLYNPEKLNRWFALSSVFMTVSLAWMITIDYDRPWRQHQKQYFVSKAVMAHLGYLDATRDERMLEIETARQRLSDAQELVGQSGAGRQEELEAQIVQANLEFTLANGEWSRKDQVLAVLRDTYEKVLNEHGPEHEDTKSVHEKLLEDEQEVEGLRKEKETWEDDRAHLEAELAELTGPVRRASRKLADLQQAAIDALMQDKNYRGVLQDPVFNFLENVPVVSGIINLPMLDFAAPRTTPARQQVRQLILPDVRQRLNYLESYTTDRCTTCHVAIDDPEFSKDRLARKLERSLEGINDEMRREGKTPLETPTPPTVGFDGKELPAGNVTEYWDKLSREQQDEYFDALLTLVNQYLAQSDRKTIDLGHPLLAHPDLDLFLSVDSAHPMAKMGCTVCHEGNPQETDFVLAAHSSPTHKIREQWEDKYYTRRLGIPTTTFETVEHYWDRPMLLPQYSQAGCAKCHTQISDIAEFEGDRQGQRINLGRHLFTSVGCINCHDVQGLVDSHRVGPDLSYVASKLQPGFVQQWAYFPQDFRPSTRMPHFFMQENNGEQSTTPADAKPVLRTQTEVVAMSKYLFTLSREWQPLTPPEGVQGDAQRGRELFKSTGCLACHANISEFGEEWISKDLAYRNGLDEQTAKHRYLGMTHPERVRYAMEHFPSDVDTFLDPESARFDSNKEYNPPIFTRFAPELSGMGSKTTFEWLYSWLVNPTHYSPDTKMPDLRLTPSEAADIATYLLTLRNDEFAQAEFELDADRRTMVDDLIFTLLTAQRSERRSRAIIGDEGGELTNILVEILKGTMGGRDESRALLNPMTLEDKKLLYLGNKMIAHYGCYTCHSIRGFEDTTPVGTELTLWAEKPVTQLDFANYDHAFHHLREEKPEIFGLLYPSDAHQLNELSPIENEAAEEIAQTHAGFAKHKLLNPRIWDREKLKAPYVKLKMPNFYFTEKEAEALTTYLLSRIPPRVSDALRVDYEADTLGPIAMGRSLTRELNCIACHEIDGNAPTIQQYFRRQLAGRSEFDSINAPPSLIGEGAKVQHNWFHRFLQQVEPLRPWLQARMPSFTLTGDQATILAEYFAALSKRDAEMLTETRAPIQEYQNDASGSGNPGAALNWFEQEDLGPEAQELRRFAVQRRLLRSQDLDLLTLSQDRLRQAHQGLLERIDFISELYDVAYPFVEPPRPLVSQKKFQSGFSFFTDMGCLQCHVLGEPLPGPASNTDEFVNMYRLDGVRGEGESAIAVVNNTYYPVGSVIDGHTLVSAENKFYDSGDVETKAIFEGPNPAGETERILLQAPGAPNLSLTYQRLRRTWVYKWMLEPGWMQPGTQMPKNFADGVSPFVGDSTYPGDSEAHINMLVDFLYQAGATSMRTPVAKTVMADESEEFDDEGNSGDEEFDDDDFDE